MRYFLALFCFPLACLVVAVGLASPGKAGDLCRAVALRDVGSDGSPSYVLQKGDYDEAITQYNVNKRTGEAQFCSHGGSCYPTRVLTKQGSADTLRLLNCVVDRSHPYDDGQQLSYGLTVIRSAVPAAQLRKSDIEDRLGQLGLCTACADNVAQWYVQRPQSQCGTLARRALEGDPIAAKQLQADPPLCTWHYR